MLDLWLSQVKQRQQEQDGPALASLVSPDPTSHSWQLLRHNLQSNPNLRPATYTSLTRSTFPQHRPLADFVAAFLLYSRDADLTDTPDALEKQYTLLEDCFKTADRLFAQGETGWFVPTLRKLTRRLVDVALAVGRATGDTKLTRAGEAARMLGRPMGVAANDRTSESPCKRDALFFLANATFRVYFALSNLRLCDTVLNNTQNSAARLESFPKGDRCAFLYYRGRIALYQRRLPQARNDLRRAFALCSAASWRNGRLILTYLVAASLPLGFFPSLPLLQHFNLHEQYASLLQSLKRGDFRSVLAHLDAHQEFHLRCGNYLLLREKLEVLCWRNLARRVLFITTNGRPLPPTGPPTLALSALLAAARLAFPPDSGGGGSDLDLDDVESMCVSLMEQGYLKAYILHSKGLLVLQKGPQAGFPPVSSVNAVPG
ncbi:COP9 signalosome complex subunit 12 [Rhodotorula diobovata]|uniref:COP9 signalosome complex subunit 12 n=1 Tax=Rhodotorula diobovata TaxID=5288 RepID=A0A5C5G8G6_9BASI|nr:COP9 signalosome complex subunit 12 [Rhodotorula diobovata]